MSPLKPENTLVVLFNGEIRFFKAAVVVTFPAIRYNSLLFELPFVIICMTIGASRMGKRGCQADFMARFAGNCRVPACKLEASLAVIKIAYAFYSLKRFFGVALRTILTKLIVVRVLMTVGAGFERYACKLLKIFTIACAFLVTFNAGYLNMLSF